MHYRNVEGSSPREGNFNRWGSMDLLKEIKALKVNTQGNIEDIFLIA